MKNTMLALAFAAAGLVAAPAAFSQDAGQNAQQGWYVGANAGYGQVKKGPYDDGDVAGAVKGGYRFALNPETSLGVEVGYVYLGRVDARSLYSQNVGGNTQSKLQGATAGLDLRYSFSPKWYGEVRGGAFFAKGEGLTNDKFNPQQVRFNSTNYYAGAGVGYNVTPKWSVALNYDYYQASDNDKNIHLPTNLYSVSAEYRF
ncbi:MAG TPA: outer membrane beta-barrel protein [Dyella sp.]|uniref:outer membrane beta-barrel protein n=1 Tax=Dyella sp. TaxID=1869338 RepID=UPI002D79A242|nr:outer membrane beta-barrel protein [Dyella sp.]HET6555658.1 outer membrane beta-barrel protein [Dyella sp.]